MKLEYLSSGSMDCPLICLYDFTASEAQQLADEIVRLSEGGSKCLVLDQLPWVESVGGCRLTLHVRDWDQGAVRAAEPLHFACGLTTGTWDNVAGLIEPFTKEAAGFQWLAGIPGEVNVLLSPNGQW